MAKPFWAFALTLWEHQEIETLALDIQRTEGPVVYFLLGAWLASIGHSFDAQLADKLVADVAPVEKQLVRLRQQREHLSGEAKKTILAKELVLEKALYTRLDEQVSARGAVQWSEALRWWQWFFPHSSMVLRAQWLQQIQAFY